MKMKKHYIFAALATIAIASCTSDDYIADIPPVDINDGMEMPIVFSSMNNGITRADITGADAAGMLGGQFVVSGYKGAQSEWNGNNIVFDNYVVKYYENTANTTQSNSANWEYVGQDRIKHAIENGVTQQSIKYWDYSQNQYDFIAWAVGNGVTPIYEGDPSDGKVLVSAITPETATTNAELAYTFKGTAADLTNCYIADLVTVKKAEYQKTVTLRFRQLGAKVRMGIYETVPGYSVKNVEFYSGAATNDAGTTPKLFTIGANDIYNEGVYTIYFPTVDDTSDSDNNQAHIKFSPGNATQKSTVEFGSLVYTIAEDGEKTPGDVFLGRSSNTASMAGQAQGNYYTQYLPNESGVNLNLRVNYTLESIDGSGETIVVKGATAQVPLIYTQWKAGYAYTYLFKISDKTNGHTGPYDPTNPDDVTVNSDPAGLYPITFDAVVVNAEEDATQETITLVSTPSITTYQKGSKVVDNNEYLAATGDIYVTVNDGNTASTPDLANGHLITLTTDNAALYTIPDGKTEAEVIDALSLRDDIADAGTIKGRNGLVLTKQQLTPTSTIEYGVDGNTITLNGDQAAKFTPAAGTYAFVYTKTAATSTADEYQLVSVAVGESVKGLYRGGLQNAGSGDVQKDVVYFTSNTSGKVTVFLGQTVNNLYLDAEGKTIASGYAATGTDYYYTTDNGMTYTKAENIAYADFATATDIGTGYTDGTWTAKANNVTTPANGTAYYKRSGTEGNYTYTYCVILPQQQDGLMVYKTSSKWACKDTDVAIDGMQYFDKYTKNNGVYYTKVIKVE